MRFNRLYLSILLLLIPILLISCGGFVNSKEVRARDFFYRDIIVIPLNCSVDPNMLNETFFNVEFEIKQLKEVLENIKNQDYTLDYEIFNNQWILINKTEDNKDIPYIVSKLETEGEVIRYKLSSPIINLSDNNKLVQKIMFPIYYIEDETFDIHQMSINLNQKYKINCTSNELIEFFEEITFYEISEIETGYIIRSNMIDEKKVQYFEGEIILNFETIDEVSYITFEVKN